MHVDRLTMALCGRLINSASLLVGSNVDCLLMTSYTADVGKCTGDTTCSLWLVVL
jgi:hypothetical protein